ncbi:hypothetical protein VTJ83DRAFT_307 [Remersonia thermophila]|uniref:Ubiquitin carboxyl-terminal hydrolase n=1 Tax=Remersonia thermophila TaxID=72144 RepID=A0ABR4DM34_9PEZI
MSGFLQKLKGAGSGAAKTDGTVPAKSKKDEPPSELTPVEKLLYNAGPIREDGSDKFFGLENFGNTCYCNSIVQALYHSNYFRENVVKYPPPPRGVAANGPERKVNVTVRPPQLPNGNASPNKSRQSASGGQLGPSMTAVRPEDKPGTPEYKKKQAMIKGPVLELSQESAGPYGMEECTFTGLRDIFTTLIESQSRTGVLSPQRFLDIFKRNNESFRNSMHQDAHEFYNIVLNDVIANIETNTKRIEELAEKSPNGATSQATSSAPSKTDVVYGVPGTGWVHDIFEGVLTSETRCLTCETASKRDETFLDLSIDLEEHSSVTSCLQSFSAEEMLCEKNKFHCDHCGGLQEAEKRMKLKKLPKILALHLKRFKYTEDYSRLQKLFHRVVYPYHLRLFNTTDDAEDPDRMYELYAVVVHIGGNAYHGHYVAVIKTKDRGWLLFDDEMVEPVDKTFVQNFFGDKPGMACAYVLFYQETTFEKVREELENEGVDEFQIADETTAPATTSEPVNGITTPLSRLNTQPLPPVDENEALVALDHTKSAPVDGDAAVLNGKPTKPDAAPNGHAPSTPTALTEADRAAQSPTKTKAELAKEKKELKAREKAEEKARKAAEKEQARLAAKERQESLQRARDAVRLEREQMQQAIEESKKTAAEEEKRNKRELAAATDTATSSEAGVGDEHAPRNGFLGLAGRSKTVSRKTMTRKSFAFLHLGGNREEEKDKGKDKAAVESTGEKTDLSEMSDDKADGDATPAAETGAPTTPQKQQPNGNSKHGHHLLPFLSSVQRSDTAPGALQQHDKEKDKDKDKPALKERFTFGRGLVRKKSSKFLKTSPTTPTTTQS